MVNARQCCTHWRISLCVVHFISFHELHSFLLSCFFFFFFPWLSEAACVVSVYKSESWCEKKELIYACGGQRVLYWGYSITEHRILNRKCRSYIYSCFWKENLNKDGCFSFTCSISFRPSLLGYSWCSLAGQNVWVSISNRALMSITSPGVSPKIHTFCQSSGIEGWMEWSKGRGEGKKSGRGV